MPRPLYYVAPIGPAPLGNATLIRMFGVWSYNRRHAKTQQCPVFQEMTTSIADPEVNSRRDRRSIDGRPLHDYANLYWVTHTPMQYVLQIPKDELVFFVFDADEILQLPDVLTTDGNAACNETQFFQGRGAEPYLDWRILNTRNCHTPVYKRKKCAEVLVPERVCPELIKEVYVRSVSAKFELHLRAQNSLLDPWKREGNRLYGEVTVRPGPYY